MAKKIKTKKQRQSHPRERVEFTAGIFMKNPRFIYNKCTAGFYNELKERIESKFNVSISQSELYYYVAQARIRLLKIMGPDKKKILQKHKKYLTSLLGRCHQSGDTKLEFSVLKEIAQIEGFYSDKDFKNEVVIKDLDTSKLTQRQIDRIIAGEETAKVLMSPNE